MINIKSNGDELLETRLNEATNPLNVSLNVAATEAFCEQIIKEPEGSQIAIRLLAHKIQSPQEKESLYGFAVFDECVKRCGPIFHQEVGKFRFLNELVKVLSPKYLALRTSPNVKKRCIECLYVLYKGIPHESKLAETYQMLKKQQIITTDPTYMDNEIFKVPDPETERTKSIFETSKDGERLSKLLKSSKPEDLKEANRIIKTVVLADNNRIEQISKRDKKLEIMHNSTERLREMLSQFKADEATENDLSTMKKLAEDLEVSRSEMFQLSRDPNHGELSNEFISKMNECNSVIKLYKDKCVTSHSDNDNGSLTSNDVISDDLLGDVQQCDLPSSDLQFISIPDSSYSSQYSSATTDPVTTTPITKYDELNNLFHSENFTNTTTSLNGQYKPVFSSLTTTNGSHVTKENNVPGKTAAIKCKAFDELDILSQELYNLKKKSSDSGLSSNKSQDDDLLSSFDEKPVNDSLPNDLPLLCDNIVFRNIQIVDNYSSDSVIITDNVVPPVEVTKEPPTNKESSTVDEVIVDLSQYTVDLHNIKPHPLKMPIVIYSDKETKVKVTVHFVCDRPHPDVSVLVAQISSENCSPVVDIVLKFAVSRPMRIRTEKALINNLSAHSPFTPSTPINEVVLLYHPGEAVVDLKYQLSYDINGESFLESATTGSMQL